MRQYGHKDLYTLGKVTGVLQHVLRRGIMTAHTTDVLDCGFARLQVFVGYNSIKIIERGMVVDVYAIWRARKTV